MKSRNDRFEDRLQIVRAINLPDDLRIGLGSGIRKAGHTALDWALVEVLQLVPTVSTARSQTSSCFFNRSSYSVNLGKPENGQTSQLPMLCPIVL